MYANVIFETFFVKKSFVTEFTFHQSRLVDESMSVSSCLLNERFSTDVAGEHAITKMNGSVPLKVSFLFEG